MDLGVPLGKLHHKSMGWNGVGLLESNLTDLGVLTKRLYKKLVCPTATSDSHGRCGRQVQLICGLLHVSWYPQSVSFEWVDCSHTGCVVSCFVIRLGEIDIIKSNIQIGTRQFNHCYPTVLSWYPTV